MRLTRHEGNDCVSIAPTGPRPVDVVRIRQDLHLEIPGRFDRLIEYLRRSLEKRVAELRVTQPKSRDDDDYGHNSSSKFVLPQVR